LSLVFDQIRDLYAEAFRWYAAERTVPPIHISFYPYIGINHTIRLRSDEVFVRIGTLCSDMPLASHKGLAYILVGKLLRKKIPPGARAVYEGYVRSEEVRLRALESKRERGRKVVTTPKGEVYDLDEMFESLNARYFRGALPKPVLTWSSRKTYRILGHHDAAHEHVAISRSLDSRKVPRYVVEYVLFHEMLHIAHPTRHINGRRYNHTEAFKRDERKFAYFNEAEYWIESNVRKLKRAARKRT
jgi:hypothetical protein